MLNRRLMPSMLTMTRWPLGHISMAKELGREKEMFFVGIDGLGGPAGGIRNVLDVVLAVSFYYPLCVDKAVEIGNRKMREPAFKPDSTTCSNPKQSPPLMPSKMYDKLSF